MRALGIYVVLLLAAVLPARGQTVVFSHESGFYADTFSLTMQQIPADSTLTIHYTFNGNAPTECDAQYREPIRLSPECYSRSGIYRVPTVPEERWFQPEGVERIIVVRAALYDTNGYRRSPVTTHTYLIDSLLGRRISLPVVSLCADSLSLFDYDTGLFVPGWYHDPHFAYSTGNYFQKGRHWERDVAFAYLAPDGGKLLQDCGLRVHGNSQRVLVQKGLSLYARREYGARDFRYPFFDQRSRGSYRRLVLRPWSTSWSSAGIEDWLCQHLADSLRVDNLATRPVVLFINGEYWGIYFLEEKADEHYVEERHGIPDKEVDLLAYWGGEVENGSAARWNALFQWLENADLRQGQDYAYLASQVDVDALMDYMMLQILILNDDWPVSNTRQWASPNGKWRWIFFDGDGALSMFTDRSLILDYMTYHFVVPNRHTSRQSTLLFRRLLANRQFLERSMVRLREIANSQFNYRRSSALLNDVVKQVENEVPYQIGRFDKPSSMVRWRIALETIDDYLRTEPEAMVDEYARYFGLTEQPEGICTVYDRLGRKVDEGPCEELRARLPKGIFFVQQGRGGETMKWIVE